MLECPFKIKNYKGIETVELGPIHRDIEIGPIDACSARNCFVCVTEAKCPIINPNLYR